MNIFVTCVANDNAKANTINNIIAIFNHPSPVKTTKIIIQNLLIVELKH
jgi:hypothetical protein